MKMHIPQPIEEFTPEQRALWQRVADLWSLAKAQDAGSILAALHPRYVGWDMNTLLPHDRDAAVASATGEAAVLRDYELHPLSVQVYEGRVGVAHYSYSANVMPAGQRAVNVTGKWSEVYLMEDGVWTMISVSGRPENTIDATGTEGANGASAESGASAGALPMAPV